MINTYCKWENKNVQKGDAARQRRDRLFEGAEKDVDGRRERINTNRYSEICAAFDAQGI